MLYFLNTWIYASRGKEGKQFGVTFPLVCSNHSSSDLATADNRSSDCFAAAFANAQFCLKRNTYCAISPKFSLKRNTNCAISPKFSLKRNANSAIDQKFSIKRNANSATDHTFSLKRDANSAIDNKFSIKRNANCARSKNKINAQRKFRKW